MNSQTHKFVNLLRDLVYLYMSHVDQKCQLKLVSMIVSLRKVYYSIESIKNMY